MSRARPCTATACLYSGRPDPQWQVPAAAARDLRRLWQLLQDTESSPPKPPPLGYRGCTLDCGEGARWFAYGGVVAMDDVCRIDPDRSFERLLLRSAPRGLIPPVVFSELP